MKEITKDRINKILFEILELEDLGFKSDDIKPEHHIAHDLAADYDDELALVMVFRNEFGVGISDQISSQWETVGDVYKYFDDRAEIYSCLEKIDDIDGDTPFDIIYEKVMHQIPGINKEEAMSFVQQFFVEKVLKEMDPRIVENLHKYLEREK